MSKTKAPDRRTSQQFDFEKTEKFLAGQWVTFYSKWAVLARWLAASQTIEVQFIDGHIEPYPADRPTALGFAFAPSKGGWIWDHFLAHKRKH